MLAQLQAKPETVLQVSKLLSPTAQNLPDTRQSTLNPRHSTFDPVFHALDIRPCVPDLQGGDISKIQGNQQEGPSRGTIQSDTARMDVKVESSSLRYGSGVKVRCECWSFLRNHHRGSFLRNHHPGSFLRIIPKRCGCPPKNPRTPNPSIIGSVHL